MHYDDSVFVGDDYDPIIILREKATDETAEFYSISDNCDNFIQVLPEELEQLGTTLLLLYQEHVRESQPEEQVDEVEQPLVFSWGHLTMVASNDTYTPNRRRGRLKVVTD